MIDPYVVLVMPFNCILSNNKVFCIIEISSAYYGNFSYVMSYHIVYCHIIFNKLTILYIHVHTYLSIYDK